MERLGWMFFPREDGFNCRCAGFVGKRFIAYFWHSDWWHFSLGLHIDVSIPNIEIHVPTGFFRIGLRRKDIR